MVQRGPLHLHRHLSGCASYQLYTGQHQNQAWCSEMPKTQQKRMLKPCAVTSNKQHTAQAPPVKTPFGFVCSQSPDCFGTLSNIPRSWASAPGLCYQVSVKQRRQCSLPEPSAKISYQSALAAVNVIIYTAASEVHPLSANIYMMDLWQMSPFLTLPCIYILK